MLTLAERFNLLALNTWNGGRLEATASRTSLPEPSRAHRAVSQGKGSHDVGAEPMGAFLKLCGRAHACGDSGEAGGNATQPGRAGTTEDGLPRAGQGTEQRSEQGQGSRRPPQETLSCHQAAVAAPGEAQHLAGYSDASLLARPLENPGNFCYANSTIVSFLWTASRVPIGRQSSLHSPIPQRSRPRALCCY